MIWECLYSVGDIKQLIVATHEYNHGGEIYRFLCVEVLHDGREIPIRFATMDRIAEFMVSAARSYSLNTKTPNYSLPNLRARGRLRGELH